MYCAWLADAQVIEMKAAIAMNLNVRMISSAFSALGNLLCLHSRQARA
jgi:hypothetical protein